MNMHESIAIVIKNKLSKHKVINSSIEWDVWGAEYHSAFYFPAPINEQYQEH